MQAENKRANTQKSREVEKQRSRKAEKQEQKKFKNPKKIPEPAQKKPKINSPPKERVATKARAQNQAPNRKFIFERHSERNCRKNHKTPARGTYKCLKANIIVDLYCTDCNKQIWKSAYYSCLKVGTSWGNKLKK